MIHLVKLGIFLSTTILVMLMMVTTVHAAGFTTGLSTPLETDERPGCRPPKDPLPEPPPPPYLMGYSAEGFDKARPLPPMPEPPPPPYLMGFSETQKLLIELID